MDLIGPSLSISPPWEFENATILVGAFDAARLCSDGEYEAFEPHRAIWDFNRLWPKYDWQIRNFVGNARLSSFELSFLDDREVNELIENSIRGGALVAIKKVDPAVLANRPVDPAVIKLRLIRSIESKTGDKLTESGRHYRLLRDIDFERFPERNYYHVVRRDEAKQILDALASRPGTAAELAELFGKARDQLTRDWRPPFSPEGLILLRRVPVVHAPARNTEPALTPSQMKKLREGWISLEVVDDFDRPWSGRLKIELPNGSTREIAPDGEGAASADGFQPGDAVVSLLDLDETSWDRK